MAIEFVDNMSAGNINVSTPYERSNKIQCSIEDVATTEERFERALMFLSYLETQWSKLDQSVAETFDWAASAAEARSTIEAIRTRWKETVARRRT